MSIWGKLKDKTIADAFGDMNRIADSVRLHIPPHPKMPAIPHDAPPVEFDQSIHAQVGLPPLALDEPVAAVPPLGPRKWTPTHNTGASMTHGVSYLTLAEFDVIGPLDMLEGIANRLPK